jgi:hypothetical protein
MGEGVERQSEVWMKDGLALDAAALLTHTCVKDAPAEVDR